MDFSRTTILFGGSFDPVHNGHLHVAKHALAAIPGAQLAFVPAFQSPGKQPPVASPDQRLHWLELATHAGPFQVWQQELRRGGPSFTVETLMAAHSEGASRENLYWLLGADAYEHFGNWKEPERIRSLARLLVVNRPGSNLERASREDLIISLPPHPASSTRLRGELATGQVQSPDLPARVAEALLLTGQNPYANARNA